MIPATGSIEAEAGTITEALARSLPSGRVLVMTFSPGSEEIEIRAPDGAVEVCIRLTDDGPVVLLRGARLELESPDEISVRCRRFEVQTSEATELLGTGDVRIAAREMRLEAKADIHLNGDKIRLNCEPEPG